MIERIENAHEESERLVSSCLTQEAAGVRSVHRDGLYDPVPNKEQIAELKQTVGKCAEELPVHVLYGMTPLHRSPGGTLEDAILGVLRCNRTPVATSHVLAPPHEERRQ